MMGEATEVPPKVSQPEWPWYAYESYTATPVAGSATAETSATARRLHTAVMAGTADCHVGRASRAEQPDPAPSVAVVDQTDSVHPRVEASCVRRVPPTAVTKREAAGYSTRYPASPELAVIATPGWLKYVLSNQFDRNVSRPP